MRALPTIPDEWSFVRLSEVAEIGSGMSVSASRKFDDPLEHLDSVAFASRNISDRMLTRLRAVGVAPHQVSILAEPEKGGERERIWRSADPFTDRALSDRVWWQLRAWVESGKIDGGIVRIRIAPFDLSGRPQVVVEAGSKVGAPRLPEGLHEGVAAVVLPQLEKVLELGIGHETPDVLYPLAVDRR